MEKYKLNYKPFIFSAGTIEPRKNITGLLQGYQKLYPALKKQYPLVIVGKPGWKSDKTFELLHIMVSKGEVIYLNHVSEQELVHLYAAATMLAYFSFYEGFGLPVAKAMASVTLVACFNATSIPEVASGCAIAVDPNSIDAINNALEQGLTDHSLLDSLVQKGLLEVKRFDWDICAKQIVAVYSKVMQEHFSK